MLNACVPIQRMRSVQLVAIVSMFRFQTSGRGPRFSNIDSIDNNVHPTRKSCDACRQCSESELARTRTMAVGRVSSWSCDQSDVLGNSRQAASTRTVNFWKLCRVRPATTSCRVRAGGLISRSGNTFWNCTAWKQRVHGGFRRDFQALTLIRTGQTPLAECCCPCSLFERWLEFSAPSLLSAFRHGSVQ